MPEKFGDLIELVAVAGVAADAVLVVVFFVVLRNMRNGVGVVFELAVEAPADALVEFVVVETHEIALNVEFDDESRAGMVESGAADVGGEALLAEEGAFADAAGVRINDEAAVPPISADIIEEMVDDAVAEGCGDDFADDWVADDEGDAAAGLIAALDDTVAQVDEVFHVVEFETVLVDSFALAFAGAVISMPKFAEEEILEAGVETVHISVLVVG